MFIFFVYIGTTPKNLRKNAKSDLIPHKTPKMDWTK